jgi:putative peptidoglycan lipid II flippase
MSVTKFALSAGAATLITRLSGLARQVVFAAVFGAGMETDAFLVAQRVPNVFRDLFAEGSMSNAFVPNFAKTAEEEGLASAWKLANALIGFSLVALGVVTAAMMIFARGWVYMFAAGYGDVPGKVEMTMGLVRVMAPFLACVSMASIFGGMLNVRGRFFVPALAPAVLNVAVIAGCLVPGPVQAAVGLDPIVIVAAASTLGGAAMFLMQYPALRAQGFRFRPSLVLHPALGRLVKFLGPALIGVGTIQIGILIDLQFAAGYGDGPVSYLDYAFRLVQLPMNLFAGAIAVAGLAVLSSQVARGERAGARTTLADSLSLTAFLVAPSVVALGVFAEPIVQLFYERGAFTAADTAQTSLVLQCYALGAFAFCIHRVVVPSYYAFGDPWTPMVLSIGTLVLKIPLIAWWASDSWFGFLGIPLSHAAVASAEVLAMFLLLGRRAGGYGGKFWKDAVRMAIAAAAMGVGGWFALGAVDGLIPKLGVMVASGAAYLAFAGILGLSQVREALAKLPIPGLGKGGLPPHVDPVTRDALSAAVGSTLIDLQPEGQGVLVHTSAGTLTLSAAEDGSLAARFDATSAQTPLELGTPLAIEGVLDITGRPPPLYAVALHVEGVERVLRASGGAVIEGEATGPRLTVPPAEQAAAS